MSAPKAISCHCKERGYIHQTTDEAALDAALLKGGLTAYIGYDCTADSLHVGHLMPTMLLRLLQRTGGKPIALIGGGTTKVGDPSFRDEARPLLSDEAIEANKAGIRRTFDALLDFKAGALMLDNAEWWTARYIPFLAMSAAFHPTHVTMDSVRSRLNGPALQLPRIQQHAAAVYDFLSCTAATLALQMGGSDQWGNIVMGVDLIRRMAGGEAHALTTPLLTTASGAKMGKTAAGAVWLNPDRLSPYDYWQFWRNTEDADVGRFLALFTELPMDEVRARRTARSEVNEAKKIPPPSDGPAARNEAADRRRTARKAFEEGTAATPCDITAAPARPLHRPRVQAGSRPPRARRRLSPRRDCG